MQDTNQVALKNHFCKAVMRNCIHLNPTFWPKCTPSALVWFQFICWLLSLLWFMLVLPCQVDIMANQRSSDRHHSRTSIFLIAMMHPPSLRTIAWLAKIGPSKHTNKKLVFPYRNIKLLKFPGWLQRNSWWNDEFTAVFFIDPHGAHSPGPMSDCCYTCRACKSTSTLLVLILLQHFEM